MLHVHVVTCCCTVKSRTPDESPVLSLEHVKIEVERETCSRRSQRPTPRGRATHNAQGQAHAHKNRPSGEGKPNTECVRSFSHRASTTACHKSNAHKTRARPCLRSLEAIVATPSTCFQFHTTYKHTKYTNAIRVYRTVSRSRKCVEYA